MSARRKAPAFDPSRLDEIDDVLGTPLTPPGPPEPDWPRVTLDAAPTAAPNIPAAPPRPAPNGSPADAATSAAAPTAPAPTEPAPTSPGRSDDGPPPASSRPVSNGPGSEGAVSDGAVSEGAVSVDPGSDSSASDGRASANGLTAVAAPVDIPPGERAEPGRASDPAVRTVEHPARPAPGRRAGSTTSDGPVAPGRRPRGQGGRPPQRVGERATPPPAGKLPVAVRVPPQLYSDVNNDLLAGPERPSYGQLVIWALEDYPQEVADIILATRQATGGQRRPGGRRMAAPDVQITLRLTPAEREFLDEHAQSVEPEDGKPVTRTEVAIACLRVALNRAD